MPRGIPWDDLSLTREVKPDNIEIVPKEVEITPVTRDFKKDLEDIGRRAAFGLVVRAAEDGRLKLLLRLSVCLSAYLSYLRLEP
jgi:hypothetical protein